MQHPVILPCMKFGLLLLHMYSHILLTSWLFGGYWRCPNLSQLW